MSDSELKEMKRDLEKILSQFHRHFVEKHGRQPEKAGAKGPELTAKKIPVKHTAINVLVWAPEPEPNPGTMP